jgi:hypothetical protein
VFAAIWRLAKPTAKLIGTKLYARRLSGFITSKYFIATLREERLAIPFMHVIGPMRPLVLINEFIPWT